MALQGLQCGGYKAVANALSGANAVENNIRVSAEEADRTLTAVFQKAQEADNLCHTQLLAVWQVLSQAKLLTRKLRLSMTGGGGYLVILQLEGVQKESL